MFISFIAAEAATSPPPLPPVSAVPAVDVTEALKESSRILLLRVKFFKSVEEYHM